MYPFTVLPTVHVSISEPSPAPSTADPWHPWVYHSQMSTPQEFPRRLMICSHDRTGKFPGMTEVTQHPESLAEASESAVSVRALQQDLADFILQCDHFSSLPSSVSTLLGSRGHRHPSSSSSLSFCIFRQVGGLLCFSNDVIS